MCFEQWGKRQGTWDRGKKTTGAIGGIAATLFKQCVWQPVVYNLVCATPYALARKVPVHMVSIHPVQSSRFGAIYVLPMQKYPEYFARPTDFDPTNDRQVAAFATKLYAATQDPAFMYPKGKQTTPHFDEARTFIDIDGQRNLSDVFAHPNGPHRQGYITLVTDTRTPDMADLAKKPLAGLGGTSIIDAYLVGNLEPFKAFLRQRQADGRITYIS